MKEGSGARAWLYKIDGALDRRVVRLRREADRFPVENQGRRVGSVKSEDDHTAAASVAWLEDHSGMFGPLRSNLVTPAGLTYRYSEPAWNRGGVRVRADLGATAAAVAIVPVVAARLERRTGDRGS